MVHIVGQPAKMMVFAHKVQLVWMARALLSDASTVPEDPAYITLYSTQWHHESL